MFYYYKLDILLTGYLINFEVKNINSVNTFDHINNPITFHKYASNIWGAQGYILTKKHAKYILQKI